MSNNNLRETKQRFTLRKNKRYKNLVSVGLGLFIATGVGVALTALVLLVRTRKNK